MSRIANYPVTVPSGVQVALAGAKLSVKGPKGSLEHEVHPLVKVMQEGKTGSPPNLPALSAFTIGCSLV